jgi:hypothetical protein
MMRNWQLKLYFKKKNKEAWAGIEPAMEVLQTSALPLGYQA